MRVADLRMDRQSRTDLTSVLFATATGYSSGPVVVEKAFAKEEVVSLSERPHEIQNLHTLERTRESCTASLKRV